MKVWKRLRRGLLPSKRSAVLKENIVFFDSRRIKEMKKAVTLTEIIIGAVILAAAFGGLLASFIGARQYIQRANKRLVAANLARQTVNDLYRFVREDEWRLITNPLYAPDSGKHLHPIINYTIDNISYEDNQYEVESVANRDYRAARVTIHYPEE